MFGERFCDVTSASNVESAIGASENVDEGGPAYGLGRLLRRKIGKVVAHSAR